ncbi:MAG TPA: bifunctional glycosyltransferase family 2/GtrA family protein [Bryobacteraceae bacterium]|nr:bifunctional glycosyltransferase family 2/GtrA family protein [Bryobacteraceae bacterium]
MTAAKAPVVVIPAYRPSPILLELTDALLECANLQAIVVVDDGSGPDCAVIFASLATKSRVHVLPHIVNLGKGAALKTGLNYAACNFRRAIGVVTADADGQHAVADIVRVAGELSRRPRDLTIGVRSFSPAVPLRSRLGNIITRRVLHAVTGQKLSDTQSGLRGIPMSFIPDLMKLAPNGYDYELDMLLACRRARRRINEVAIETIYLDGNRSSHFNPVLDSMRIYFVLLRFTSVSLITALIDNAVFLAAFQVWKYILACQLLGRAVAGSFNYYVNKNRVFHSKVGHSFALPKYWLTVLIFAGLSYALIRVLNSAGVPVPLAKIAAETALFGLGFVVQRDLIFTAGPAAEEARDDDREDSQDASAV